MKKIILFVITKSNWGGAQRYVYDLATSLKNTYDVSVALGGSGRLLTLLETQQVPVVRIPDMARDISLTKEWKPFLFLLRLFWKERPDVVHLNSSKAAGLGALAARLSPTGRIVFTAHAWAWNEDRSFISRCAIGILHYATVLLAHQTVCVSGAVYDQMARFPLTKRRMRVIHPGITPFPRIDRNQARAHFTELIPALGEKKDAPWLVTLGELHPIKGHRYALEALSRLYASHPDIVYIIVGDGEARPALETLVKTRGLEKRVFFTGHIEDAASLFSAFDVAIVPSLSEAFGYVLIEAGAAELPVIASRVGGIPEILETDGGILIPPQDPVTLALSLEEILSDTDRGRACARVLKARVAEHFTKERMVDDTTRLYTDLLR